MSKPGSDEWYAERAVHWDEKAAGIVAALREYEECHPDDSTCLQGALKEAEYELRRREWERRTR